MNFACSVSGVVVTAATHQAQSVPVNTNLYPGWRGGVGGGTAGVTLRTNVEKMHYLTGEINLSGV